MKNNYYEKRITKEDTEHASSINPPAPQHLPSPPNPYAGSINPPPPILLKQKEVAEIIRKSEAWLERKRWEGGGIPFRKMGRSVLYYEADVLEWIRKYPPLTSTSQIEEGGK